MAPLRPEFLLFGDSITQQSFGEGGWGVEAEGGKQGSSKGGGGSEDAGNGEAAEGGGGGVEELGHDVRGGDGDEAVLEVERKACTPTLTKAGNDPVSCTLPAKE